MYYKKYYFIALITATKNAYKMIAKKKKKDHWLAFVLIKPTKTYTNFSKIKNSNFYKKLVCVKSLCKIYSHILVYFRNFMTINFNTL
ncbi:hypothetical protein DSQ42_02700 [Ureaplasma urealyticum]|uniref:Uncharacterized protein n=1 Tax=Ureaplasma urealyticum TaxID=2130 RepID=A0AAX1QXQ7_UREUR|nr:hypothetical protein DSQ42_02700 [Ureaplasma urealyticum]